MRWLRQNTLDWSRRTIRRAGAGLACALLAAVFFRPSPAVVAAEGPDGSAWKKTASAFYPAVLVERARANMQRHRWAAEVRDSAAAAARPWMELSDQDLWDLMFSSGIKRSWMVWSNGHCPSCKKSVPMYEWIPDALRRPWKMLCPKCKELFPKNDFQKYYRSGLDEQGIFDPGRADRSLLYNVEHPDPADPLRSFGVDDGEGYVEGDKRWRFVGAYLIYGQWKQAIVGGLRNLSAAHLLTGEPACAHKAGVLLDRVADLYPTFDFGKEGVMYEGPPRAGYVSTWHDACVEAREIAMAYDAVFESIARDASLVDFLAARAGERKLANPKASFADIQRNIEERILRDTIEHRDKIESNYPSTDVTIAAISTVLGWPENRKQVTSMIDGIIVPAVAVDGVSGEKGIDGYSTIAPRNVAEILGLYGRMDPGFLEEALKRHPKLHAMYRFHLDTWCLESYYPRSGDTGAFAAKDPRYAGLGFSRSPGIDPSAFTFFWNLFEATGDADFVRLMYKSNGNSVEGLPYDLFAEDPLAFQERVARTIAESGAAIRLESVNKSQWCLAILRSGAGADARALWLDYDSGGRHGHADGMNLGLFAKGLDLMPDFGYPPVQYGGWGSPRAVWYTQTAAHNTILVDGQNTRAAEGKTTLWAAGKEFRAIRASGPQLIAGTRYERTAALIDVSARDSYVLDVFRVEGGKKHAKCFHSSFGQFAPRGLSLEPTQEAGYGAQMRGFQVDRKPPESWSVDWKIEDRPGYLPPGSEVHLKCTELTPGSEVLLAEGWVSTNLYGGTGEAWIPRLLVRRRAEKAPLASAFVSVIEPYEKEPAIEAVRRLGLAGADGKPRPETDVALELRLAGGRCDVILALDPEGQDGRRPEAGPVTQEETGVRLEGELCWVRLDASRRPRRVALSRSARLEVEGMEVRMKKTAEFVEIALDPSGAVILSGAAEVVEAITDRGTRIWPR